uniref:hypothetical protein n=1 Tax=Pelistega indica TaxID=1414851 RepID=UPI001C467F93
SALRMVKILVFQTSIFFTFNPFSGDFDVPSFALVGGHERLMIKGESLHAEMVKILVFQTSIFFIGKTTYYHIGEIMF